MKFSKLSQLFLVSSIGLLVATLFAACQLVSIDVLYVSSSAGSGSSSNGLINIYDVDSASGAIRPRNPAASSGGENPVSMAVTSSYANLYVANQGSSNNIVHLAVDINGALTAKDTFTGFGTPVSVSVNQAGTYLFAAAQQGTGGALLAISLGTDGTMSGSSAVPVSLLVPGHSGDTVVPTGVFALANNNAVYVTAYDQSVYNPGGTVTAGDNANPGWIFGFTIGSNGILTPTAGSPYQAGVKPSALVADPTSRFVYVTDFASSQLIGYTIQSGSTLSFFLAAPTHTGNQPGALTFDPRGKFLYIVNELDSTVSALAIDQATGATTATINVANGFTDPTDTDPVAVVVDPALGRFVYTANFLGNSVSGFRLDSTGGALTPTQATPYPSGAQPTALACIPHGNHASQSVTP
jgi:6-phosphogluconolactonase (cycloisomerase 2 family)